MRLVSRRLLEPRALGASGRRLSARSGRRLGRSRRLGRAALAALRLVRELRRELLGALTRGRGLRRGLRHRLLARAQPQLGRLESGLERRLTCRALCLFRRALLTQLSQLRRRRLPLRLRGARQLLLLLRKLAPSAIPATSSA